jgi:hypothetical protein
MKTAYIPQFCYIAQLTNEYAITCNNRGTYQVRTGALKLLVRPIVAAPETLKCATASAPHATAASAPRIGHRWAPPTPLHRH